jgi:hypothetical protein
MKVLLISPYHVGSRRAWAEGYHRHSAHEVALLCLPARFWKWRMHGGAVTLVRHFRERLAHAIYRPDLMLATDMLNLTTWLALTRLVSEGIPMLLYMHENQLTYPLPPAKSDGPMRHQKGERDLHYAFINYASMLAADRVVFNSRYHYRTFFEALHCHTFPILPHRLSYPEIIPEPYHLHCLYQNHEGLVQRLRWAPTRPRDASDTAAALVPAAASFDWSSLAPHYDAFLAHYAHFPQEGR